MRDDLLARFGRRLRFGMIGGGVDSLIGETHRYAARVDNRFDVVAGCLSIDPRIAARSAQIALIDPSRSYANYREMLDAEVTRADGIEVVTICTPPHLHAEIAMACLGRGLHVICEKPMTKTATEAHALAEAVRKSDCRFVLTHCYTGYPMVREARARVAAGALGEIRLIETDFVLGAFLTEEPDPAKKHWRFKPEFLGPEALLGEVGTHAHNMACYITGLQVSEVATTMKTYTPDREVYDDAVTQWRFDNGATGRSWCSYVAAGNEHGLAFRIYGDKGSLLWQQEHPETLRFQRADGATEIITPGHDWLTPEGQHACRLRGGHPEGYVLAFANLYRDFADLVIADALGIDPDPLCLNLPTVADGVATMQLIEAANTSNSANGAWTDARSQS